MREFDFLKPNEPEVSKDDVSERIITPVMREYLDSEIRALMVLRIGEPEVQRREADFLDLLEGRRPGQA